MPVPHRAALATALAASLLTACATPPAAPAPQTAPAAAAADAVKVGQSRADVEAALGVPTQVEEDTDGVQAVYMTGMPDLSAYRRAATAGRGVGVAQGLLGTATGLAGLLGPVGVIGGAALSTGSTLVGEAASLGARAATPATPALSHVSVLTVTYREDKVVRIARQSLAGMAAG
jgi:hypothetical protein